MNAAPPAALGQASPPAPSSLDRTKRLFGPAGAAWLIVSVAAALRVGLAGEGGQLYFGDEKRFLRGAAVYFAWSEGAWEHVRANAGAPDHTVFTWLGFAATAIRFGIPALFGASEPTWAAVHADLPFAAAALGLASALNIWLVSRLARIAGASPSEATFVLLLAAASTTWFYHSRHLLPYDCSLSAALGALVCGLRRASRARALGCGLLAGTAYGLYNGYWFLIPLIGLAFAARWYRRPGWLRSCGICLGGMLLAIAVPLVVGRVLVGPSFWAVWRDFSTTVSQGLYSEGWSLPWEYLWHSEGLLGVAVFAAIAVATLRALRRGTGVPARLGFAIVVVAAGYGLLVAASVGLEAFVVYARSVKPLLAGFCIAGGWALASLAGTHRVWRLIATGAVSIAGAANQLPHWYLSFPRELELAVWNDIGTPKKWLTFSGCYYAPQDRTVTRPDLCLVNAHQLYPLREFIGAPPGDVLHSVAHPLQSLPYQYEGHSPRERSLLREHPPAMQLVRLAHPERWPDEPPPTLWWSNPRPRNDRQNAVQAPR